MKRAVVFGLLVVALAAACLLDVSEAKKDPKDCEVCIKVIDGIKEAAGDKYKKQPAVEKALKDFCKGKLGPKEKKACYYMSDIQRLVSKPISMGMPANRVCQRLKKDNSELCELRFPVKVEKGSTDYTKLRVKALKQILNDRGVVCTDCLEKGDFVKKCQETEHMEL
mmetsp:Transcript_73649/g.204029  ORF Transcript_73649/g.204029 Transcript_73649/m.204029 type:complete len:167 (-) Transcript_73649:102-602(-)